MSREASRTALVAAAVAGGVTLLVCLALIHALPGDAYWAGDNASRALLAQRLLETRYTDLHLDYPAAELDPSGAAYPLPDLAVRDGAGFVSIFPVAYAALAAPGLALAGPAALRWPAALGSAACAALFALWLAPWLSRAAAALAGLALGLATPLFFYGVVVWEHSLCVALCLGASLLARHDSVGRLAAGGALLGLACWLREELVLFVATYALACGQAWRRPAAVLAPLAGALPLLLALGLWNAMAYGTPLGPHTAALDPVSALASADVPRRFFSLFVGYGHSERDAATLALLALAAVWLPAFAAWQGRPRAALALAAGLGLALWIHVAQRTLALPPLLGLVSYNGWLPQLPAACLAGVGAVALARDDTLRPLLAGIWSGVWFLALATVLGLASQSVFATGLHVGPRLLLPSLPALAALAVLALREGLRRREAVALAAAGLFLAAGAAASLHGVMLLARQQRDIEALERALRARPERFVVSGDAMLTQLLAGLWYDKPLLYAPTPALVRAIAQASHARGDAAFLVLAPDATPVADPAAGVLCGRLPQAQRASRLGYVDTPVLRCALDPARASTR